MEKWLVDLLDANIGEDGVLDKDAFKEAYSSEAPKNSVPKQVFNDKLQELKDANATISQLKESDSTEDLQAKIEEYETKLEEIEKERVEERKLNAITSSLSDSVDPDFVASLIKDKVEFKDGELTGLEDVLNEYKEKQPYLFKAEEARKEEVIVVDNKKLANTKASPLTKDDILAIEDVEKKEEAINNNLHLFE